MARKSKKKQYFTKETEEYIIRYNKEEDQLKRSRLYNEGIKYPFEKLVENIINTFKFDYIRENFKSLQHEVVTFLVMNMHKFKEGKGKAFSYFSIVAKNYLIISNNKYYDRLKTHNSDLTVVDKSRNIINEKTRKQKTDDDSEFFDLFIEYCLLNNKKIFQSDRDVSIANAIIELFISRDNIENFNKKSLYIIIREMTGIKTQYITKVTNVYKGLFFELREIYNHYGTISMAYPVVPLDEINFDS